MYCNNSYNIFRVFDYINEVAKLGMIFKYASTKLLLADGICKLILNFDITQILYKYE